MFRFGRATTQKRNEIKEKVERAKEIKKKIDEFKEETETYQQMINTMMANANYTVKNGFLAYFIRIISEFKHTYTMIRRSDYTPEHATNGKDVVYNNLDKLSQKPVITFEYIKDGVITKISSEEIVSGIISYTTDNVIDSATIEIKKEGIITSLRGSTMSGIILDITYESDVYHAHDDIEEFITRVNNWILATDDYKKKKYNEIAQFCKDLKEKFTISGTFTTQDPSFDGIFTLMSYIVYMIMNREDLKPYAENEHFKTMGNSIDRLLFMSSDKTSFNATLASGYIIDYFVALPKVFPISSDGSTGSFELPEIMMVYEKKPVNAMFKVAVNATTQEESITTFDDGSVEEIINKLIGVFGTGGAGQGSANNYVVNVFPDLSVIETAQENDLSEYSQLQNMIAEERSKIRQKGNKGYVISFIQDDEGTIFNQWNAEEVNSASSETVQMAWYNGSKYIKMPTGYSGEPVDFRDDNYYKNCIYLENNDNLSYTRNADLNGIMTSSGQKAIQKMCGYFVITTSN